MIATTLMIAAGRPDITESPTTDGTIALFNLNSQIDGLESEGLDEPTAEHQIALVELIALRGLVLSHITDYERAEEIAERLVCREPANGAGFVARARTRATFHRFADALSDLEVAERLSFNARKANAERAAIFQAVGRYDEALVIREEAANHWPSFETLGALAGLCAERGETGRAEDLFAESCNRYRGVSPFPLALLNFQCGLMWMNDRQLDKARTWFDAARRRVPAYAPAQGHLAEVEAELGEVDTAIASLLRLAEGSDDPDYAAQLAHILAQAGRSDESQIWSRQVAASYDDLVERHPEAFADHAAEFWLAVGNDPKKALQFARINLGVRKTPRSYDLLSRADNARKAVDAIRQEAGSLISPRPGA
jgi:tetratricopeptide (TPR) repeat protein